MERHHQEIKPQPADHNNGSSAEDVPASTEEVAVRKPGSKGAGKKRTKSGCLSEFASLIVRLCLLMNI